MRRKNHSGKLTFDAKPKTKAEIARFDRRVKKWKTEDEATRPEREASEAEYRKTHPLSGLADELDVLARKKIFNSAERYAEEHFADLDLDTPKNMKRERKWYKKQVMKFKKLAKKFAKKKGVSATKLIKEFDLDELFYYD